MRNYHKQLILLFIACVISGVMGDYRQEAYIQGVRPAFLVPFCTGLGLKCFGLFENHSRASFNHYEELDGCCRCSWLVLPDGTYSDAKRRKAYE